MATNFLDEATYFSFYETKYKNELFKKKFPLVSVEMSKLCEKIKEKADKCHQVDFFRLHAEIVGLDIKLQIILYLINLLDESFDEREFSEEQIIEYANRDYRIFMKELCEMDELLEHSLCFSVV